MKTKFALPLFIQLCVINSIYCMNPKEREKFFPLTLDRSLNTKDGKDYVVISFAGENGENPFIKKYHIVDTTDLEMGYKKQNTTQKIWKNATESQRSRPKSRLGKTCRTIIPVLNFMCICSIGVTVYYLLSEQNKKIDSIKSVLENCSNEFVCKLTHLCCNKT